MKFKLKKIATTLLVVLNIFTLSALPAYAGMESFLLGNPVGMLDSILGELGINKNELKNTMNTVNVSRKKITPPMVSLTFDPTDPVPGEKVTVTAMPTYFMNQTQDLYFTWFIKGKRCFDRKLDSDSDYEAFKKTDDFDKCNLDGDSEVDINDYKIKAARILANNDFDWQNADYSKDGDDDGYDAVFGGDDQRGKNEHCFVHDVKSGDDYELEKCEHLFADPPGDDSTGDGVFGKSEEQFWHTSPTNKDTSSTGNTDEANVSGLGLNVFSFPYTSGDKIGIAVEGVAVQPTQEADSSYRTMWAFTKNTCDPTNEGDDTGYPKTTTNTITTLNTPSTDYTTAVTTTTTQSIVENSQVNDTATIRTVTTVRTLVTYTDPISLITTTDSDTTTTTTTCPRSSFEGDGTSSCSGYDEDEKITMTDMNIDNLNDCLYVNLVTPTEGGGSSEKLDVSLKYTPENPINDSSDNANGDTLSFTTFIMNATNPAYLSYTWEVYASNEPNPDSWGTAVSKDSLNGATQTSGLGIDTLKFNLNLKDSDFADKKVPKYLKVKVTVKDTLIDNGEREGHADSVIPLFSSEERIKIYTAKTYFDTSSGGDPTPIISLPAGNLSERCLFEDPKTKSTTPQSICEVAKNELLALEVDNKDDKYTDFLWTVDGKTNTCPDANFSNCIDAETGKQTIRTYFPILKDSGDQYSVDLSMLNAKTGERLSLNRMLKVSTPEVKIVPKEKDASEKYICRGLLLGKYLDFNGESFEDRSTEKFQALAGNNIELKPTFYQTETPKVFDNASDCPYVWNVDGINITTENATDYGYGIDITNYGNLILPPKNAGEKYVISFSTIFTPTNATRKALNKYWDITYNEFYEKKLTHNIEIEMVGTEIAQKANSPKKILATVSSGIPSYLAFLFRIVLSGMAIILSVKLIFFVLPKTKSDEF